MLRPLRVTARALLDCAPCQFWFEGVLDEVFAGGLHICGGAGLARGDFVER